MKDELEGKALNFIVNLPFIFKALLSSFRRCFQFIARGVGGFIIRYAFS
jgi:hypothetical protein